MRILILSEQLYWQQRRNESVYDPPSDIRLDVGHLNFTDDFTFSVFDYDVSIVHVSEPSYNTIGYYENLPKLMCVRR